MENCRCPHIYSYKSTAGLDSYEIIHGFYVACLAKDSRRIKAKDCTCREPYCNSKYQRIHACLSCPYFGCFNTNHIHNHARENGHVLAVDINFGYVFCFECNDYQYDTDFDRIALKQKSLAACKKGGFVKWEPNAKEVELSHEHVIINVDHIKGLRGIKNLGNTCYMSVMILSLVHAPVFRDFLLSLKHKCNIQSIPLESQVQVSDQQMSALEKLKPVCFVCEMSKITQEFFCGKSEPFIPDRLLYLLWLHSDQFRNTGQHDAHEFLETLLDFLHLHHQGKKESISTDDHSCNCIVDTIFTCILRHEHTCQGCKHTLINVIRSKGILLEQSSVLAVNNDGVSSAIQCTLSDFLKRTQSDVGKKTCISCNERNEIHKKMTLNKIGIVLPIYLQQNAGESDQLIVSFPEFLDMTPFITTSAKEKDNPENGVCNVSNNMYYLFAVVVYNSATKDGNGGHYTSFVRRHKNDWFYMNDAEVTTAKLEDVLRTKAYLLFYHKEILEYEDKQRFGL